MSETCARCGHVAGLLPPLACPTCGKSDPLLGGSIWYELPGGESGQGSVGGAAMDVLRLCHTYVVPGQPSCYIVESRERAAGTGRWS